MRPGGRQDREQDRHSTAADGVADEERASSRGQTVGALLRQTRLEYGLELDDIAAVIRIKSEYLAALETHDVKALPAPAYAVGFLRAYGEYMRLDADDLVRRFKRERTDIQAPPELNFPVPLTERGIPGSSIVLVALIVCVIGYGSWTWYVGTPRATVAAVSPVPQRMLQPPPSLDPPAISPDSAAAAEPPAARPDPQRPAATPAQVAALPSPSDPMTPPADHVFGSPTAGAVVVKATADSWIEVLDNDHPIWSRLLKAGDIYNPPKDGLTMLVGNAGGIEVTVNGKTLPPLGNAGEVRRVALDAAKIGG
jgi:cytoskeleton protein RodZ